MSIDAAAFEPGQPTQSEDLAERHQSESYSEVSKATESFESGISPEDEGYAPASSCCSKEACSCCENESCDETGDAQTEDENRLVIRIFSLRVDEL
jgi:hypothetical protein